MKKTVLLATEVSPCPPHGGENIHVYNLIECLTEHFEVIVLAPKNETEDTLEEKVSAWYDLPKKKTWWPGRFEYIRKINYQKKSWATALKGIISDHRPCIVWFSYGFWGQYAHIASKMGAKTIMGTHNIQSNVTLISARNFPFGPTKWFTYFRLWQERQHENKLFKNFDKIVSVGKEDFEFHSAITSVEKNIYIPNFINEHHFQNYFGIKRKDNVLVMTANFHSVQNQIAVAWFVREVWPMLLEQNPWAKLKLVGDQAKKLDSMILGAKGVIAVGRVRSVEPYLRGATIAVVPLLCGSGTRLKIMEAWACGAPIVSTTLGAAGFTEGCGQSLLLADDAVSFKNAILSLLQDPIKRGQLAHNGLQALRENYTNEVNSVRIKQAVESLLTSEETAVLSSKGWSF